METEEIFGAIIVLVIIIVVALIVLNMGDVGGDIRRIADEVFGWTKQQELEQTVEAAQQQSTKFMERLAQIYTNSLEKPQTGCTYDLKEFALSDKYKVEVVYYPAGQTIVKFNLLDIKENKLIATKTIERTEDKKQLVLIPCYNTNKDPNIVEEGGDRIEITYTSKDGLKAGLNKLYDDLPKFYKKDQTHLCFATPKKNTDEYKKPLLNLKDCESGAIMGEEQTKEFFNAFIESINRCRTLFSPEKDCKCNSIHFEEMLDTAAIIGVVQGSDITFELYYNNKKIDWETLKDTKAGNMEAGIFDTEITFKPWQSQQTFNKASKELFIAATTTKELAFATPSVAEARIWKISLDFARQLEPCTPDFQYGTAECKPGTNIVEYSCLITNTEFRQTNMASKESIQKYFETKDSVLKGEYKGKKYSDYIYETSQKYGINPVVMLATMQKEQSLIGMKSTTDASKKIERAFGCGISDNKNKDITLYLGFDKQVDCAGNTLKKWYDDGLTKAPTKMPVNGGKINQQVNNAATYSLYKYTPYTSISGAGGNLLFFNVYKQIKSEIGIEKRQPAQITQLCTIQTDKFGTLPVSKTDLDTSKGGGKGYDPFNYPGCPEYNPTYYPNRCESIHRGMDIYTKKNGVAVLAIADGELFAVKDCTYILHTIEGQQYTSIYCHVNGDTSLIGKKVKQGDKIGTVNYNPPHVHLEVYKGQVTSAAPTSKYESGTACIVWDYDPSLLNPNQVVSA